MCEDVIEVVESVQPGRVFSVERGGIWFSGLNQNVGTLARRVAQHLQAEGYEAGEPRAEDAGLFLPVEGVEAVSNDRVSSLVSPPGGDMGADRELTGNHVTK